jgi:hypothetical protein
MAQGTSSPSDSSMSDAARNVGLSLSDDEVRLYAKLMAPGIAAYQMVDAMPDEAPEVRYPRTPGRWPAQEENRHNAWPQRMVCAHLHSWRCRRPACRQEDCRQG